MTTTRFSTKPWMLGGILALFLFPASVPAQQPRPGEGQEPFHPTRVLAKFAGGEKAVAGKQSLLLQQGLKIQRQFRLLPRVAVLDLEDATQAKAAQALVPAERARRLQARIAALRATGLFEYVEPDYVRSLKLEPTDAAYTDGTLWALHNFGQNGGTNGADIGASAAWDLTTGSTNVIVAVMDTGIRYTHRDLAAQMWHDPVSYTHLDVYKRQAVDRSDNLADFSNYGQTTVHLGAPGVDIYSCVNSSDSAYASYPGTSMATPHVSGVAALLLARYPNATLTELRRRILDGVVQIPSLTNKTVTGGRLSAYDSLAAAPKGALQIEVSPRAGQPVAAGKTTILHAIITDLLPVTNAIVTANIAGFTNLTLFDGGTAPDVLAADGVYSVSFLVPTNLTSLEVTLQVSAPTWPDATNFISYPVVFPPSNDNFTNRLVISNVPCQMRVTGSNLNASMEVDEPIQYGEIATHSVWWSWTAPSNAPVKITTYGSSFDTLLAVYTNQTLSSLGLVAANDQASYYDDYSQVSFEAIAGTEYQLSVDGWLGSQGQIVLSVLPLTSSVPLDGAIDCPGLASTTGGSLPWLGQTCVTHDGTNAVRSGPIEANGQSWIEASLPVAGTLTFWWKVSCEWGYDYLNFSVNGVEQASISGEVDWQQKVFVLGAGSHQIRWTYSKDFAWGRGEDTAWLDRVSFVPVRSAIPQNMGDLDGDGQPTVLDMTLLVGYLPNTNSLRPEVAVFADVNRDGGINSNDIPTLADAILGRASLLPALDTDGDGIPDVLEPLMGLDPTKPDSDANGTPDGLEDSDQDSLSNAHELLLGTNPSSHDTDGDGWWDEAEMTAGSDALDPRSRPFIMAVSSPQVSLVLPANEGPGGLTNNTVVAMPPVALVLPADQGPEGLALNTTVAQPPVAMLLPWDVGTDGLSLNTSVALPPVALMLPADQGPSGLTNNTVIAQPPVRIELDAP